MTRSRPGFGLWSATLIIAWAVVIGLLIYPVLAILFQSLRDNDTGALTAAHYVDMFADPYYRRALIHSLVTSFFSMMGALVLGLTLAFLTTRFVIRGRSVIAALTILVLVSPAFISAYAWVIMFGANGFVRNALASLGIGLPTIYGRDGIILVFTFKYFPYVYLLTASAFSSVSRSVEEAAESLGMSPARRVFQVTLPLIAPAVSASALLTFVLSIADYGAPAVIGRDYHVLSTEAYQQFTSELGGNLGTASTISMVLMVISLILVALQRRLAGRGRFGGSMLARPTVKTLSGWRSAIAHGICYGIVGIAMLPALVILVYSFRRTSGPVLQPGFGLQSYTRVLYDVPQAVMNSLTFSLSAVVLIVVLGTLVAYVLVRRPNPLAAWLDNVLMLPYIVPGVVMGIGFLSAFNRRPLLLTGSGLIIVLVIFIRRLPYSVRSGATMLSQLSRSTEDAAVSLGCRPASAFWRVTLPLMLPGVFAGALMSFVTAIDELSSSLVLYVGPTMTMPVRIYLSVLDGDVGTASALSTILLAVTAIAVFAALRLGGASGRSLL